MGEYLPFAEQFEAATGSCFIRPLTYSRQCSSTFALSSVHFRCFDLMKAAIGAVTLGILSIAFVTLAILCAVLIAFLKKPATNDSRAATDGYRLPCVGP